MLGRREWQMLMVGGGAVLWGQRARSLYQMKVLCPRSEHFPVVGKVFFFSLSGDITFCVRNIQTLLTKEPNNNNNRIKCHEVTCLFFSLLPSSTTVTYQPPSTPSRTIYPYSPPFLLPAIQYIDPQTRFHVTSPPIIPNPSPRTSISLFSKKKIYLRNLRS